MLAVRAPTGLFGIAPPPAGEQPPLDELDDSAVHSAVTVLSTLDESTAIDAPMVHMPISDAGSAATRALVGATPVVDRESVPFLPPPPTVAQVQADDAARRALLGAITPSPAAMRREAPPSIPRVASGDPARRRSDASSSRPPPIVAAAHAQARAQAPFGEDAPTHAMQMTPPAIIAPTHAPTGAIPPPTPSRVRVPTTPPPRPSAPNAPVVPLVIAPRARSSIAQIVSATEPPITRIHRGEAHAERPFTPPKIIPIPEIPEPGLANAARYAARFARARYQRRGAIKALGVEIKQDTEALDQVLGALGRTARDSKVEGRVFSAENAAITAAEERIAQLQREHAEVDARKADENSKFADVERERTTKLSEAERGVEESGRELLVLEGQRRGLRDRRKDLERRQKAHLKSAEDQDRQAGAAQMGDQRSELRRAGESHRKEAAALEPERQDCDRMLAAIERPIIEATARQDAAKAELDAAKRSLADAREGHTHRLAELDAEHKRKAREIGLAEGEIARRLVTLGTLVNLNRIEDGRFAELYLRIDRLRGAITARTTEIEKLAAERDAYDRGMLVRGVSVIGGAFVLLIALIVILRAIL